MSNNRFSIFLISLLLFTTTIFCGVKDSFQRVKVRNFPAPDSGIVHVRNPAGVVTFRGGNREDIEIRYRLYADAGDYNISRNLVSWMKVNFEERDGILDILVELPLGKVDRLKFPHLDSKYNSKYEWDGESVSISSQKGTELQAELEISLPEEMFVIFEGMISSGEFAGIEGGLEIEIDHSQLELNSTTVVQDIALVSGKIELVGIDGDLNIAAVSADIEGELDAVEILRIATSSGDVKLESDWSLSRVELSTVSGDIELEISGLTEGHISGASGDIELKLNGFLLEELDIGTISGDVKIKSKNEFSKIALETVSGKVDYPALEDDSGILIAENTGGSGSLNIETISGKIKIEYK